jgi:ABC-type Fe3+ transport system permease subunit
MLRLDMEAITASVGGAIAFSFPGAAAVVLAVLIGLLCAAFVWRRIAPWREQVRLANEEANRRRRGLGGPTNEECRRTLMRTE